jgi:regulatory LacI family protein
MTTVDGVGRRPTIYDVAARAGVSKSLVSLVVAGSPQVSERRRAAVLSAIAELDYRPSQAATILASARTRSIEVLIDDYRNLSFVGLVRGVRDGLADHDYYVTVTEAQLNNSPAGGKRYRPATPADGRIIAAEPAPRSWPDCGKQLPTGPIWWPVTTTWVAAWPVSTCSASATERSGT